jgi:hypothetical protein
MESNDSRDRHDIYAMTTVGLLDEQQQQIFQILSGILNLGNLTFTVGAKDKAEIGIDGSVLNLVAALFGVTDTNLEQSNFVTNYYIRLSTKFSLSVPQNVEQALIMLVMLCPKGFIPTCLTFWCGPQIEVWNIPRERAHYWNFGYLWISNFPNEFF